MDLFDELGQELVGHLTARGVHKTCPPVIKARRRHLEGSTQDDHRVVRLLRLDEGEGQRER